MAGGSAGLLAFESAGAATFVAGATSGMAGAAAAGTFTQGMQMLAGERQSFDLTALSTETSVGGWTGGLGQLAARSIFASMGQNLSGGLQSAFGVSRQTACAISSTVVSGASGVLSRWRSRGNRRWPPRLWHRWLGGRHGGCLGGIEDGRPARWHHGCRTGARRSLHLFHRRNLGSQRRWQARNREPSASGSGR